MASQKADPWAAFPLAPKVGRSEGMAQAFGQGATLGFGDEIAAGIRAFAPGLSNWLMGGTALKRDDSIGGSPEPQTVSTAPTMQGRYDEELNKERTKSKAFEESNPVLSTGSKIAGGAATAALLMPVLPAGLGATSPSLTVNALRSGAVGAGLGGVTGYGEGEGEGRTANAMLGGTVGAVTGAAVPFAIAGAKRVAETPAGQWVGRNVVAPTLNRLSSPAPKSLSAAADGGRLPPGGDIPTMADSASNVPNWAAVERIATAIQKSGKDPAEFIARARQLGPETVLADLDPSLLALANGATVLPGQTRRQVENVLIPRDRQASARMVGAFEGGEPPPPTFTLRGEGQAFDQNLRAVGQRVYGDMEKAGLKQSPELMEIYENPNVAKAITTVMDAEKGTRTGTSRAPASPVEIMHKVKQAIWNLGFDENTARPGPAMSWYRDLGTQYVDRLKAANPALAEADKAYSQAASLPEFFDAGRNWLAGGTGEKAMNSSAPALENLLASANPQQVAATRAGSTNAARETMRGRNSLTNTRALARDIETSGDIRGKLVELYGPERAAQIMAQAETEGVFANTSNKLLTGSRTAHNAADALNVGGDVSLPTGGGVTNFMQYIKAARDWAVNPNEEVRNALGRTTVSQDANENRRILEAVADILRRRREGNAFRTVLPEAASSGVARDR